MAYFLDHAVGLYDSSTAAYKCRMWRQPPKCGCWLLAFAINVSNHRCQYSVMLWRLSTVAHVVAVRPACLHLQGGPKSNTPTFVHTFVRCWPIFRWAVAGYLITTLLHIFRRMCRWKNFENRSTFGEGMDKSWRLTFSAHSVDVFVFVPTTHAYQQSRWIWLNWVKRKLW